LLSHASIPSLHYILLKIVVKEGGVYRKNEEATYRANVPSKRGTQEGHENGSLQPCHLDFCGGTLMGEGARHGNVVSQWTKDCGTEFQAQGKAEVPRRD
jgi:hypothetical protein